MAATQKCKVCGKRGGVKKFYKNPSTKTGFRSTCKECEKVAIAAKKAAKKEAVIVAAKTVKKAVKVSAKKVK